jgi:hypothetical protein
MSNPPARASSSPPEDQRPNAARDDEIAMKLARDNLAVELLTNRILTQARTTVFTEQRVLALAVAAILGVFGITSWMSIEDKVHSQVDKRVDATLTEKITSVLEKTQKLEKLSQETEDGLNKLQTKLQALSKSAEQARADIQKNVDSIKEFHDKLDRQAKSAARRPADTSAEITAAFGALPPNMAILTGSAIKSFGTASDTPTGGAFTTEFLKASRSSRADANGDHVISLAEATEETRKLLTAGLFKQEPTFTGDDVGLFRLNTAPAPAPAGRILAIVVGVGRVDPAAHNGYTGNLSGPKLDINHVRSRLEEPGTINRQTSSVVTLADEQATWPAVESAIGQLQPTANDLVVFYFSGLGARRNAAASAESPGSGLIALRALFYDQAVDISQIVKRLELLKAQHRILIFDS